MSSFYILKSCICDTLHTVSLLYHLCVFLSICWFVFLFVCLLLYLSLTLLLWTVCPCFVFSLNSCCLDRKYSGDYQINLIIRVSCSDYSLCKIHPDPKPWLQIHNSLLRVKGENTWSILEVFVKRVLYVQEVFLYVYTFISYYIKWVKTSWTYSTENFV